jgi:hypothetical protein
MQTPGGPGPGRRRDARRRAKPLRPRAIAGFLRSRRWRAAQDVGLAPRRSAGSDAVRRRAERDWRRRRKRWQSPPLPSDRGAPSAEEADNSAGFATARTRRTAAPAGALRAPRRPPAQGKTDRPDRIACGDGDAAAALCQRQFGVIRRSCRRDSMSDKVGLSTIKWTGEHF